MNQDVIFTIGIPGSGKSTWCKKFVHENQSYIRINRDDLRNMRGDYMIKSQESLITKMENEILRISLESGYSVVIDATNMNVNFLEEKLEYIKSLNKDVFLVARVFDIDVETAVLRDSLREKPVGREVIEKFKKSFDNLPDLKELGLFTIKHDM